METSRGEEIDDAAKLSLSLVLCVWMKINLQSRSYLRHVDYLFQDWWRAKKITVINIKTKLLMCEYLLEWMSRDRDSGFSDARRSLEDQLTNLELQVVDEEGLLDSTDSESTQSEESEIMAAALAAATAKIVMYSGHPVGTQY